MLELVTKKLIFKYDGQEYEALIPGLGVFDDYYKKLNKCKTDLDQIKASMELGKKMKIDKDVLDWIDLPALLKIISEASSAKKNSPTEASTGQSSNRSTRSRKKS